MHVVVGQPADDLTAPFEEVGPAPAHSRNRQRRQARSQPTQRAILDAAREAFLEKGFAEASIADVVARSAASVGSLYHHFGDKAGLFIALWKEHQHALEERAARAIRSARAAGETDSMELFLIGARAFLEECWDRRDLARLFMIAEGPSGFLALREERDRAWNARNERLFQLDGRPLGPTLALVLRAVVGEAAREVVVADNKRQARRVIRDVLKIIGQLRDLH